MQMLIAFMHARRFRFFVSQTREHFVSILRELNRDSTSPCLMPPLSLPRWNDNLPTLNTAPNLSHIRPFSPPLLDSQVSRSYSFFPPRLLLAPHLIFSILYAIRNLRVQSLFSSLSIPFLYLCNSTFLT